MNENKDLQGTIINLVIKKCKENWFTFLIFLLLGFFFAIIGFDLDKESSLSLFNATATIISTLIGFIGIFVSYRIQNIFELRKFYIGKVDKLKGDLKRATILIIQYEKPEIIKSTQSDIKRQITDFDNEFKHLVNNLDSPPNDFQKQALEIIPKERNILKEIDYTLELINNNLNLDAHFNPYKDYFIFAICGIFIFMIPIAFNHINFSNDNYLIFFNYWKYIKMPLVGLFIGMFYIILRDLANMLHNFFTTDIAK
ncbi:MAG: hypothetical protein O8C61_10640 [Candidatus Methanoperedens sp.]|nr:hypothetical protein [Candidatus Methanoperedens sp.]